MTSRYFHPYGSNALWPLLRLDYAAVVGTAQLLDESVPNMVEMKVNVAATSLFLGLPYTNPIRRFAIHVIVSTWFKILVLLVILANSVCLGVDASDTQYDVGLRVAEYFFVGFFLVEAVIRIVACGFVCHSKAYLRKAWNWLDVFVLAFALFGIFGAASLGVNGSSFAAIRIVRVFRPLRSFAQIRTLREVVNKMSKSIPAALNVGLLLALFVWFAAALALQLIPDAYRGRCFLNVTDVLANDPRPAECLDSAPYAINESGSFLVLHATDDALCGLGSYGRTCEDVQDFVCSSGGPVYTLTSTCRPGPYTERSTVLNFQNIVHAALLVFKLTCKDNWPSELIDIAHGCGAATAIVYTVSCTFILGYLCVNFFTAVFESNFSAEEGEVTLMELVLNCEEDGRTVPPMKFTAIVGVATVRPSALFASVYDPKADADDDEHHHFAMLLSQRMHAADTAGKEADQLRVAFKRERAEDAPLKPDADGSDSTPSNTTTQKRAMTQQASWWKRGTNRLRFALRQGGVERIGRIVLSQQFNVFGLLVVGVNLGALASLRYPDSAERDHVIDSISLATGVYFYAEAVLKLIGLGPSYFLSSWNLLDLVICIVMIPEFALGSTSSLTPLRALRMLKLLKLGKRWTNLRKLLVLIRRSVVSVAGVTTIGFIFLFSFALFGTQLFGIPVPGTMYSFETFGQSFLVLFVCITGEDAADVSAALSATTSVWANLFFVVVVLFGNFIWANLFIAVILENFASLHEGGGNDDVLNDSYYDNVALYEFTRVGQMLLEPRSTAPGNAPQPPTTVGQSTSRGSVGDLTESRPAEMEEPLLVHEGGEIEDRADDDRGESAMRAYSISSEAERYSPSSVEMQPMNPEEHSEGSRPVPARRPSAGPGWSPSRPFSVNRLLGQREKATRTEASQAVKDWAGVLGDSLWLKLPPTHGLRSRCIRLLWHPAYDIVSLLVTLSSSILLVADSPGQHDDAWNKVITDLDPLFASLFLLEAIIKIIAVGFVAHRGAYLRSLWNNVDFVVLIGSFAALALRPLRFLRALRVLRLLNVSFTLRVIVRSIAGAIPGMGSVLVFLAILFCIWGTIGLELYRGKFYHCTDPSVNTLTNCAGWFNATHISATGAVLQIEELRQWVPVSPPSNSFDSIWQTFYSIFKLCCGDRWQFLMYTAMNSDESSSAVAIIYFVSFMLVGKFFAVQLFIGVLVDRFVLQRQRGEGYGLLTEQQQQWITMQKVLLRVSFSRAPKRPTNEFRGVIFDMVYHAGFEWVFGFVTLGNAVVVSLYGIFDSNDMLDVIGQGILALMFVEIVMRLIAQGRYFFRHRMNWIDVVIVVGSVVALAAAHETAPEIVRIFRTLRLLFVFRRIRGLRIILDVYYHALPEIGNVGLVLLSVYYLYAVLGTQLFHDAPLRPIGGYLDEIVNFRNVGNSMLSIYIIMTQEYWAEIGDDLIAVSPYAYIYVVLLMVSVGWIGAQLLVTVLIDVYSETDEMISLQSSVAVVDALRDRWSRYDRKKTKTLSCETVVVHVLPKLSSRIWPPQQHVVPEEERHRPRRTVWLLPFLFTLRQLQQLHIPLNEDLRCNFDDCLASVALKLFRLDVAQAIAASREAVHGITWNPDDYCIHHKFAAVLLTRVVRSYLRRRRLQRVVEQHVSECQQRSSTATTGDDNGAGGVGGGDVHAVAQEPSSEAAQIISERKPDHSTAE